VKSVSLDRVTKSTVGIITRLLSTLAEVGFGDTAPV
jgi:hypothetical protein